MSEYALALGAAFGLAAAFPKTGITWIVPLALVALLWAWSGRTPVQAARVGYVAGVAYFTLMFAWFGETAGALVGPLGFVIVLGPALVEALAFAVTGALSAYAATRVAPAARPLAFAAAFTFCEWARSSGTLGVPFAQLGVTQVEGPLAALGAFVGGYGITFALCALGGFLYLGLADRAQRRAAGLGIAAIVACAIGAWALWPARHAPAPTIRVAALQGNIKQSLKWTAPAVVEGIDRYTALTRATAAYHPQLVVWPETVVATYLSGDPQLRARFAALARSVGAPILVGTLDGDPTTYYNALWTFNPDGTQHVYRKRRLVPFAESLPAANVLGRLPGTDLISRFAAGPRDDADRAGSLVIGPLICWESAFAELSYEEARAGAQVLVVATDDAWFGESAGPFQHAQIAQMRAIETGRWVVRAAATGISGIIAPDGRYVTRTPLDVVASVLGRVGMPVGAPFLFVGPYAIALACALLYVALVAFGRRRNPRR